MAVQKFLIGFTDENSGFQTNLKPWLINDNAFETLENAYVYRGRVRKRFGSILLGDSQLNSRVRIFMGTTDGSGSFSGTVPGVEFEIGQLFSVGPNPDIFTVYQTGTPASMLSTSAATGTYNTTTGQVSISNSQIGVSVFFYPATPIMGITQYLLGNANDFSTIAFDTQFSYIFDIPTNFWVRLTAGTSVWTGTDYNFFWSTNYQGATADLNNLWTTNFVPADGIRFFDGTTWHKPVLNYSRGTIIATTDGSGNASGTVPGATGFIGQVFIIGNTAFAVVVSNGALSTSSINGTDIMGSGTFNTANGMYTFTGAMPNTSIYFTGNNFIRTGLIIVQFKSRLLLLNTVENVNGVDKTYVNRIRYSGIGDPSFPTQWMMDVPGYGSATDAPTQEAIKTAQFLRDRLIVYFEFSTYELAFTGNQVQPFVWQKINTELGAKSTFSEVPFDQVVLGIGNVGIHACSGNNVERIDSKIPSLIFSFHNDEEGTLRIAGIRDYYTEMVYWTYPSEVRDSNFYFPNKVLTFNYVSNAWGINDDSFTSFGYTLLELDTPGATWGETTTPWAQNLALWNNNASADTNVKFKCVVAGNQEGYIVALKSDVAENAPGLQITNMALSGGGIATLSVINHNLAFNDFVLLGSVGGVTFTDSLGNTLDRVVARVSVDPFLSGTPNSITVTSLDNLGQPMTMTGTYIGGGTVARVSNINLLTKQYNFFTSEDRNIYIPRVDFLVDKTENGQVTVDYLVSSTTLSLVSEGLGTLASPGPLPGNGTLDTKPYDPSLAPLERFQSRLWHPVYLYAEGQCVQLQIYMNNSQMYNYDLTTTTGQIEYVALQDFQLNAMVFYATPTSRMQ
jgi:hypothetical protein